MIFWHGFGLLKLVKLLVLPKHHSLIWRWLKNDDSRHHNTLSTTWTQKERKEASLRPAKFCRLCTKTGTERSRQATTYLWLKSKSLRSLLQNFHRFVVGNSTRQKKKKKNLWDNCERNNKKVFWPSVALENEGGISPRPCQLVPWCQTSQ